MSNTRHQKNKGNKSIIIDIDRPRVQEVIDLLEDDDDLYNSFE
jgi:hypothetical protein